MKPAIVEAVLERAGFACECCGQPLGLRMEDSAQLDHVFGRARAPDSVESIWCLRLACHEAKSANRPSARHWLERFLSHAEKHGYSEAAERARARLEGIVQLREARP